ncbi:ead/Ea22-like family protein [Kluyvera ascorbata]|uniref:ead/Ea22-like family protein n=1 Tax=Kluyvera ascorbata TaxID=51288 RepID=UPI0018A6321F|nr:hypothetical protein KATP_19080 [Kluyvera ascorbata]HBL0732379.1 ead/Ea22-like family protein [Kluyvera ascorbata]
MNDITALMATMKAAAEKASNDDWVKESGDGWEATCSANDQANGGFIIAHFEGPDAAENREFVQAASPANVKTLVEALEKAQRWERRWHQVATRVHEQACDSDVKIEELEQLLSDGVTEEALVLRERIAELESRTVTVKLPLAVSVGGQGYREQVVDILAAAGIQVIEGEGQ